MAAFEKITVTLLPEMAALVHQAVDTGEFASSNEIIQDALQDWTAKRGLQLQSSRLRQLWEEAVSDDSPGVDPDEVFDRLERKYQAMVDAASLDSK